MAEGDFAKLRSEPPLGEDGEPLSVLEELRRERDIHELRGSSETQEYLGLLDRAIAEMERLGEYEWKYKDLAE